MIFPSASMSRARGTDRTAAAAEEPAPGVGPFGGRDVDAGGEVELEGVNRPGDLDRLAPRRMDADDHRAVLAAVAMEPVQPVQFVAAGLVPLGPEGKDHDPAVEGFPGRGPAAQPGRFPKGILDARAG